VLYKTKEYDPERKTAVKVPGRIVMNTQTVSVFKDDSYTHALFTFNLAETQIMISKSDICCFYLINANRQHELCGFNNNCGTETNPIWVNEWFRDFGYFKQKCYEELKETNLHLPQNISPFLGAKQPGNSVPLTMTDAVQANLSGAQKEMVEGRRSIIEKEVETNQTNELGKKVTQTQTVALTALRREINLEDLIKTEEVQKGREENMELQRQVEQEKKKKKILTAALEARDSNFAKMRVTKDTQKQIEDIKKETKLDIKFKRAVLKKKLDAIKNKFKRKNRLLQQQVQLIRSEMAEEIMNANKKGDAMKCKHARNEIPLIKQYCDQAFGEDYNKNISCKNPENFCYSCCEGEFGNMFITERDDCLTMCDDLDKKDLEDGDFVWTTGQGLK
jgi:hypothetical protein